MDQKLIFIDIDGTLYSNRENIIPTSSIVAIFQARKKGNKVFLCTGRSLAESADFLNLEVDGFLFAAGASVYVETERIYDRPFTQSEVDEILNVAKEMGFGFNAEGNAGGYCNDLGFECIAKYFTDGKADENYEQICLEHEYYNVSYWHPDDSIYKIVLYSRNKEEFDKIRSYLREDYQFAVTYYNTKNDVYAGEVTIRGINKFSAIERIASRFGKTVDDCVAIGDSENDVEMLLGCGVGIAMGNALDAAKQSADYVTKDILADGLIRAFQQFDLV